LSDSTKSYYARNREEWRAWLEQNHKIEKKVHLIKYKKHTGKPSLSHRESIQEAICFGWIDTTIKRIDDEKYRRTFVKRTKNSRWSNATLGYAKNLIKEGKMTPEGLKAYQEGLKKPVIDHGLSKNPEIPEDLKKELEKNDTAMYNFNNFAPSYKRQYIIWVVRAKRDKTRIARIEEVVKRSFENKKLGIQ
jgi:uncharacterized protein YdeI (YjbR/CyaY-like superfamily)